MCLTSRANGASSTRQAIIYPLELIRTRLAVSPSGTYRGIAHCARMVLRHEGWRAFYRGLVPSMVCAFLPQHVCPPAGCVRAVPTVVRLPRA